MRVAEILPHAKIVSLPAEVGDKGDVSDFFVRLKHIPQEFEMLLAAARPLPPDLQASCGRCSSVVREVGP
jgi:hypothetical protein